MERSADRYLHKKFKKQLNIERSCVQDDCDGREAKATSSIQISRPARGDIAPDRNSHSSNDSVPKVSTKGSSENTFSAAVLDSSALVKSSISVNAVEENSRDQSETIAEKSCAAQAEESADPQSSSANSYISYVISKSSSSQPVVESLTPYRAANFDTTRFNVSEPSTIPSSADKSSILDNVYSKQYVTSKLVNLDRLGDISSSANSTSLAIENSEHHHHLHHHYHQEEGESNQTSVELTTTTEKSASGKYICSYCNLACSKPSVLQKHIRAHTNERPYPCVSCGFSFKTRSNLYKHCRSRTHANRVMGNKAQEVHNDTDTDSQNNKMEYSEQGGGSSSECGSEDVVVTAVVTREEKAQDVKTKPYKPRFHTAKAFFDDNQKDGEDQKVPDAVQNRPSSSDLLSLHINEVINKNNAIVNSNESYMLRKRSMDSNSNSNVHHTSDGNETPIIYPHHTTDDGTRHQSDEPLNLTNKSRKRCLSEIAEPTTMHTSLIKELLLKNLYADSMQCPHCKMIFQTVTELELHKLRSCKGYIKSGARYSRSSSVNVASILTKNKNAFDNIPHMQNAVFPLKSPGPFLGKTRLVESDKNKSFSFDDGLPNFQNNNLHSPNEILRTTLRYSISPLTIQHDKLKKTPVKLFGGEVKIHTSGETKSFKIDGNDGGGGGEQHLNEYRLSENRVVKSSLQSGGTVLHNKTNYNVKQDAIRTSPPDVIRVYDNTILSPSIDLSNLEKTKFNFDRQQNHDNESGGNKANSDLLVRPPADVIGSSNFNSTTPSASYKYTSIMDFSQNAVKLLAPNLKQPNLTVPGVPIPNKIILPHSPSLTFELKQDAKAFELPSSSAGERFPLPKAQDQHLENIQFAQKQIILQQKMAAEPLPSPSNLCNPVNLLVNGKVVRYVPGIPGPVAADVPLDVPYRSSFRSQKAVSKPMETSSPERSVPYHGQKFPEPDCVMKSPKFAAQLEVKTSSEAMKSPAPKGGGTKSPNNAVTSAGDPPRKFARPNTLALKPSIAAHKQHHGLTPTMFNQILISPDTPRVAKKYMQHFLHGNYFSYLGLKSSTKSVYCTLNKTQPSYVPHFKKLSMYSEWRQQDTKADKLYVSGYDSRQRQQKYVTAGKANVDLVVHSSYKFVVAETASSKEDNQKPNSILGGYESNEDYTYVRGRGRGRYVCDQCGIRCKKPSMLKKHIRTHTNDRPFTCSHCNFSFKTKGNLTKHMKSKAHTKNYAASSSSSSSSTQQSGTQSSESDTDDSGMDSSDESTRQQEHEAAYGLLSLSQKPSPNVSTSQLEGFSTSGSPTCPLGVASADSPASFMNTEQVTQVNNTNFARNKILDQRVTINFDAAKIVSETSTISTDSSTRETQNLLQFLGKTNTNRPLTYPYTSDVAEDAEKPKSKEGAHGLTNYTNHTQLLENKAEQQLKVVQKQHSEVLPVPKVVNNRNVIPITITYDPSYLEHYKVQEEVSKSTSPMSVSSIAAKVQAPMVKINDRIVLNNVPYNNVLQSEIRKRKMLEAESSSPPKLLHRINPEPEAMDLSMPALEEKPPASENRTLRYNGVSPHKEKELPIQMVATRILPHADTVVRNAPYRNTGDNMDNMKFYKRCDDNYKHNSSSAQKYSQECDTVINLKTTSHPENQNAPNIESGDHININYVIQETRPAIITTFTEVPQSFSPMDYDNSAMETLADVATKQVKLEKNTLAKSVASEYLKLATKNEFQASDGVREPGSYASTTKEVNELIVKPEENKSCTICSKNFSKPSQLRLHMNIHYLERPFRCDPCSVSFRTKGHLQKHERSASHHNKLSSSPLLSSSEPRPFKCSDCNIAFRIHGHLAKHLRSKMHIMKLECLAKIPFGLYAELERANSLLTEINTTDGDQCLESLKVLARKVFINDPSKLNQLEASLSSTDMSDS